MCKSPTYRYKYTVRNLLFGHLNIFCNKDHLNVHLYINRQDNRHNLDSSRDNTAPDEDQVDNRKKHEPSRNYLEWTILKNI